MWKYISLCFYLVISLKYVFTCSISLMQPENKLTSNKIWLLALPKIWSKVHEKNISRERSSNFGQLKTFFEKYQSMRVWICLVYKISRVIVARDFLSSLFSSSWQNKYSNLKTICHINQNVSCELNSLRTYYFQNIPYLFLQF